MLRLIVDFKNGEGQGERHRDHFHPAPNTLVGDAERYTFGSIYNNVVNSRLSSESGGFSRIF